MGTTVAAATRFTDPASVETWDACFRWRVGDALRDVTIDDSWSRVAESVVSPARGAVDQWAARYIDAFRRWRLLADERLLRCAGTGLTCDTIGPPVAVLNVAAFVDRPIGAAPRFDRAAFLDTAALAVRLLDDALPRLPCLAPDAGLRIGLMGFGDALGRLGVAYTSASARDVARTLAVDLAEGCLRGAVALAEERGTGNAGAWSPGLERRLTERGMPAALLDGVRRHGLRHVQLTSIERHPLLARLANGTSDALDPVATPMHAPLRPDPAMREAEQAIAAAMQPWIDAPIGGEPAALAALVRGATQPPRLSA